MKHDYIGFDDDDLNAAATGLETQAAELDAAATAAEEAIPEVQSGATDFETTYEPDGIHKAKATELTNLLTQHAAGVRNTASTLREMATKIQSFVGTNAEVQAENAANTEDIDVEGIGE